MWSSKRSSSAFSRVEIGTPLPGFLHTDWYRRIWNQRDDQPCLIYLHAISLVADACATTAPGRQDRRAARAGQAGGRY